MLMVVGEEAAIVTTLQVAVLVAAPKGIIPMDMVMCGHGMDTLWDIEAEKLWMKEVQEGEVLEEHLKKLVLTRNLCEAE